MHYLMEKNRGCLTYRKHGEKTKTLGKSLVGRDSDYVRKSRAQKNSDLQHPLHPYMGEKGDGLLGGNERRRLTVEVERSSRAGRADPRKRGPSRKTRLKNIRGHSTLILEA